MIVDCDVHYIDPYMFDGFRDEAWVKQFRTAQLELYPEHYWQDQYRRVSDPSWPDCPSIAEFNTLPLYIRKELKEQHQLDKITVSDDFNTISFNSFGMYPELKTYLSDMKTRLGVDRQVLNYMGPATGLVYKLDPAIAAELMTRYNDKMYSVCQAHPEFDSTAWIAYQDLPASLNEIDRAADRNQFGLYMSERPQWGFMPNFDSVAKLASRRGIAIYLHFTGGPSEVSDFYPEVDTPPGWETLDNRVVSSILEYFPRPEEGWIASIASLIYGHAIDRYPDLKIVLAEQGIHWIKKFRSAALNSGLADPLPYLQKNFWFTTEVEHPTFVDDANTLGWDRLLFATDYPHDDPGGRNMDSDVDRIQDFLNHQVISQTEFDNLTYKNYLAVSTK